MSVVICIQEFKDRLDTGTIECLFDLRNPEEFDAWRIEGKNPVETINIPQLDFVGEEEQYFPRLPKDKEIIAICAHGDASKYCAELLRAHGFTALSLEGGMDAWSEFYEIHRLEEAPAIHQVYRVAKGCITHVLIAGTEAIVIDPVRHLAHIEKILAESGARLTAVLDTHLQADHLSGGRALAEKHGASYWLHPLDGAGAAYAFQPLTDGVRFPFGGSTLEVIHSPGHTPGSISLLLDQRFLFSGDTIMKTTLGRPDLGGKAAEWSCLLYKTLYERFRKLSDEVLILPSHATSVRDANAAGVVALTFAEARTNEMYHVEGEAAFAAKVAAALLENPERYQEIRRVNLGLVTHEEQRMRELEIGKNLCGMAEARKKLASAP
jgi:glyoxylase-like metal-dependent hydrolase (beta-lactamase superfamily II)